MYLNTFKPAAALLTAIAATAVSSAAAILKVGDPAPKLQTGKWVQGEPVKAFGKAELKRTVPAAITARESLDIGVFLGPAVAESYAGRRLFKFDGKFNQVKVELK